MSYNSKYYSVFSCCLMPIPDTIDDTWDQQIHVHTTEELFLFTSKNGCVLENNGSTYQIPTPAFVWNRAGAHHNVTYTPPEAGGDYLISFVFDILDDIPEKLKFWDFMEGNSLFALTLNETQCQKLKTLFDVLGQGPLTQRQLLLPCIFHQISQYLMDGAVPIVSDRRHGYISQVLALLEGPSGLTMTSKQLAEQFHVNRNTLEADFKQATGQSVYTFRRQLQLQSARALLVTTDQPLSQIALACGFTDKSHLIHSFQKKFGKTPGVFRIQHAQKPRWYK